jgi:hypothetical protein
MSVPTRRRVRRRLRGASDSAGGLADAVLVAELEFDGGPLDGRCMTGLAWLGELHVCGGARDGAPRLVCGPPPRHRLGTYRLARRYDCPRRVERVHVYRWSPGGRAG